MKLEDQVKPVAHTPGYFVSSDGKVFSDKYGRRCELKQAEHKGYRRVCLSTANKRKHYPVHRLVAEAFIPNADEKPFVNHKDGNKRNNDAVNLQWCTASENQKHAYNVLNIRNGHEGYKYAKLYPNEELRSRLVELGIPRWRHNLAELGEMLPAFFISYRFCKAGDDLRKIYWQCYNDGNSEVDGCDYDEASEAETEADARAKMLIHLKSLGEEA